LIMTMTLPWNNTVPRYKSINCLQIILKWPHIQVRRR
jgi:hypothetical protein